MRSRLKIIVSGTFRLSLVSQIDHLLLIHLVGIGWCLLAILEEILLIETFVLFEFQFRFQA